MTLILALWRPWRCTLPDHQGYPCGTRGWGAATKQQHCAEHRGVR